MKIALIVPEFPPHSIGGGGTVYDNLTKEYAMHHDLLVIYGRYNSSDRAFKTWANEDGVTFAEVPELPYPSNVPSLKTIMPASPRNIKLATKTLVNFNPDVIHIHGYGHVFVDQMAHKVTQLHIPYLFTNHGFPKYHERKGGVLKYAWKAYIKAYGDYINKNAALITCVSEHTKSEYAHNQEKVVVVENGINIKAPSIPQMGSTLRSTFAANTEKILLSVGRISVVKGFQDVLPLLAHHKNWQYVIIGNDEGYEHELIAMAKAYNVINQLHFVGKVSHAKINEYYSISDCIVIPSKNESFGLIGLEALVNKKPVVHSGVEGLIYLDKSANATNYSIGGLEVAIKHALSHKFVSEDFLKSFSWDSIANKYILLLNEITN